MIMVFDLLVFFKLEEINLKIALFFKVVEIDAFITNAFFGVFKSLCERWVLEVEPECERGAASRPGSAADRSS